MTSRARKRRAQGASRPKPPSRRQPKPPSHAVSLEQDVAAPPPEDALTQIREIERIRGSRVITLFAYPDVLLRGDIPLQLYTQLRAIGRVPRLDLFLHSSGGETELPWRIITLIRDYCDHFGVLIPYLAHSAATQIAMGADEIVMGDMSELGPTDPWRNHPLLPQDNNGHPLRISVQDLRQCIAFLKREGGEYTPESLATIYSALFEHVHPLALGAIEQSYALARLISEKALATHMDPSMEQDRITAIVDAFSDHFCSHSYRIAWKEAQTLGLPITHDRGELWEAMWRLYEHYAAFQTLVRPLDTSQHRIGRQIVWIDTTSHRQILEEQFELEEDQERPGRVRRSLLDSCWIHASWEGQDTRNIATPSAPAALGEE